MKKKNYLGNIIKSINNRIIKVIQKLILPGNLTNELLILKYNPQSYQN